MRSIGEPHRAGMFSRASRTEMLCRKCMRAARRRDVPSTPVLYLIVAGVIIALTALELCFAGPG
jgi:hypothetical protein